MRTRFIHKDIEAAFNASCAGTAMRSSLVILVFATLFVLALGQVSP